MRTPFDGFGNGGVVYDLPAWDLPKDAYSDALNVRFRDGAAEGHGGQSEVFGTPLGAAYRLHPISTGQQYYWVYAGTNRVWATDGGVHADISSNSASYSATDTIGWNGGAFQRHMVLNTGREPPQVWEPNLANPMVDLPSWESGLFADVIRPFRNYLFALRCTESGVYNPRLLRHSNGAVAGNLPSSWDYTDPNEDTGRVEFGQTTDPLVDALALRDQFMIYKSNHAWAAQYVGGVDNPFIYRQVFSQVGLISQYCAVAFEGMHCVLSTDDALVHDGNQARSILDKRARQWLFSQIDATHYQRCYLAANYRDREVWICFPTSGYEYPTTALVWNWTSNTLGVRELGQETPHIGFGVVNPGTGGTFDTDLGTFDEASGSIDEQAYNPSITSLLMADPSATRLLQVDDSGTMNGATFTRRVHREALPFGDILRLKRIMRVFPKMVSVPGEVFEVYIGTRMTMEDSVVWTQPQTFTVGADVWVDFRVTGRIIDIRMEYSGTKTWRLHGFDVEWESGGYY